MAAINNFSYTNTILIFYIVSQLIFCATDISNSCIAVKTTPEKEVCKKYIVYNNLIGGNLATGAFCPMFPY